MDIIILICTVIEPVIQIKNIGAMCFAKHGTNIIIEKNYLEWTFLLHHLQDKSNQETLACLQIVSPNL
jgi:hypothetical protein